MDLKKAAVSYKTNNPAVITVDAAGTITAKKPGVASVFADVTFNGKTVSSNYPVKVMPNLQPQSISVDGTLISGFDPKVKAYSYLLTSTATVPQIKAAATDYNAVVEIEQANGIPGTAVINIVDYNSFEKNTYYINFDVASVSDEFNAAATAAPWQWLRENKTNYNFTAKPGSLTVTTEPGDVSEKSNNAKNVLLQSANNDWVIETKLLCSRTPLQPENAGSLLTRMMIIFSNSCSER